MNKKLLIVSVALALVACFAVGMTIAYLTDKTDPVVNTFEIGKVDIELTETTQAYQIIPGGTQAKDPKVTVKANSEKCYVFVKIDEHNISGYVNYTIADGWTALSGQTGVYYRTVNKTTADQDFAVLANNQVAYPDSITNQMMDAVATDKPTLTFTAYAIQFDNVTDVNAAWAAVSSQS